MLFDKPYVAKPIVTEPNQVNVSGEVDASRPRTVLHLQDGQTVELPTAWLLAGPPETSYSASPAASSLREPVRPSEVESSLESGESDTPDAADRVIPMVEEQARVGKRAVETGKVRIRRREETFTEAVDLPLTETRWELERVPKGVLCPERPEPRQEDGTTIYPVVEERLQTRLEYFLREEVHVRHVVVTTQGTASVELKRDVLEVEREEAPTR